MSEHDPYGSVRVTIETATENREIIFALAELWIAGNPEQFAAKVGLEVRNTIAQMLGVEDPDAVPGDTPGSEEARARHEQMPTAMPPDDAPSR